MADYISRALVADALAEWREQLRALATASPLRDAGGGDAPIVDLTGAHPSGLAQLFAGRPTLVSAMIRDQAAQPVALQRARAACDEAEAIRLNTGVATGALVVGTAAWSEDGRDREVPIVLRLVTFEPARGADTQVTLHDAVTLNPVFATEMRARAPDSTIESLAADLRGASDFDPRLVWNEARARAEVFGPDFEVRERLLLGSFDDPEQRLVDDVDECDHLIASSLLLASVAGDHTAREELTGPASRRAARRPRPVRRTRAGRPRRPPVLRARPRRHGQESLRPGAPRRRRARDGDGDGRGRRRVG